MTSLVVLFGIGKVRDAADQQKLLLPAMHCGCDSIALHFNADDFPVLRKKRLHELRLGDYLFSACNCSERDPPRRTSNRGSERPAGHTARLKCPNKPSAHITVLRRDLH